MSFREDVFAKIVTYITVAVLLGAMLVEAFVIYRERREQTELEAQVASAQETINDLSAQSHSLTAQVEELQEFQDKWENFVILADNEFCQKMREDLSGRPEVIPEEAVEASQEEYIPYVENEEGQYTYEVPVEALDMGIDCAAFSKNKEKWYDRTLVFKSASLPQDALLNIENLLLCRKK